MEINNVLKWVHTRNLEGKNPSVYLVAYLRDDILEYTNENPYKYVVRMSDNLHNTLMDEDIIKYTLNGKGNRFMGVKIERCNECIDEYLIYEIEGYDYPDLDTWWSYLNLNEKVAIYKSRN